MEAAARCAATVLGKEEGREMKKNKKKTNKKHKEQKVQEVSYKREKAAAAMMAGCPQAPSQTAAALLAAQAGSSSSPGSGQQAVAEVQPSRRRSQWTAADWKLWKKGHWLNNRSFQVAGPPSRRKLHRVRQ